MRAFARRSALAIALLPLACVHQGGLPDTDATLALRPTAPLVMEPMLRSARLVPQVATDDHSFGVEPGGGVRVMASGVRVVNLPNGAVMSAEASLPSTPSRVVEVPERMGGGFLFLISSTVWRADRWLGPARPLYRSNDSLSGIVVGLDRVYLQSNRGAEEAIDPRTGAVLDLGAWPPAPRVQSYGAMDGWRAVAATDLRGVIATFDAGASWHPLPIDIDATEIRPFGGGLLVAGLDASRTRTGFEVRPDGQVAKLATLPTPASATPPSTLDVAKPFGNRPLVAAVEDGWPLADGTVVVARDGALARVRLEDGAVVEIATNAFPMRPARCHPIPYGDGVAFVCGEQHGKTAIYRYENGALVEARHYDEPRAVFASGTGAVVVRGSCDPAAFGDATLGDQRYCVIPKASAASPDGTGTREIHLRGDVGGERVTLLTNGKLAVVSPPHGDLATARLTLIEESGASRTVAISFPAQVPRDALRVLKNGLWLDGVEERRPGVLGGWIESSGAYLGYEIEQDGKLTPGNFIRDTGKTIVSGKYGLGWSAARRGYETTDGGMTWKDIVVPEPIRGAASSPTALERACGPLGCVSEGWVRVGWGARAPEKVAEPVAGPTATYPPPKTIALTCEPTRPPPKIPPTLSPPVSTAALRDAQAAQLTILLGQAQSHGIPSPSWPRGNPSPRPTLQQTVDWIPFFTAQAPSLRPDDAGYSIDAADIHDSARLGSTMRFYAWGARGTEWEHTSRWLVRWLGPFSAAGDVQSTLAAPPPTVVLDSSHFASAFGIVHPVQSWTMIAGDDPQHALLLARRSQQQDVVILALEAGHAPVEIRRSDGEPFSDVQTALRMRGRWFLLAPASDASAPRTTILEADGSVAHPLVSLPRTLDEDPSKPTILAARSDGRALGVIVEGDPLSTRPSVPIRWALSIDADDATVGGLEPLGAVDFADRAEIGLCTGDEAGWVFDAPWPTNTVTATVHGVTRALRTPYARIRETPSTLCIEKLTGAYDAPPETLTKMRGNSLHGEAQEIDTFAISAHLRYPLRCSRTP